MHCTRKIQEDLYWVGANDRRLAKFENIHPLPEGTSYNSYVLLDEKNVLFDTVDWEVSRQFLDNIEYVLDGRELDYIIINHLEPDHGASLKLVTDKYPEAMVICSAKAKQMMGQFEIEPAIVMTVKEGQSLSFGKHEVEFITAPMVHWPEVLMTYDSTSKTLFSADAFGAFGALDGKITAEEYGIDQRFEEYFRRYYTNIVGKYGPQVQKVLKKVIAFEIETICPLHGPVLARSEDIAYGVSRYEHWAAYEPEEKGVLIVYASMYGGTQEAAESFAAKLCEKGFTNYELYDVSTIDVSYLISKAFKYSNIALFSVTYNLKIFPPMNEFIEHMELLNLQNRKVSIVQNGTWAPKAGELIGTRIAAMKNMEVIGDMMTVKSKMTDENDRMLDDIVDATLLSMK